MTSEEIVRSIDEVCRVGRVRFRAEADDVYRWTGNEREVQLHCLSEREAVVILMQREAHESRVKDVRRLISGEMGDDVIRPVAEYSPAKLRRPFRGKTAIRRSACGSAPKRACNEVFHQSACRYR